MADENPEKKEEEGAAKAGGGLFSGMRGWIIVIAVTLLQAAFWIFMMVIREPGDTQSAAPETQVFLEDPAILQSRVEVQNFSATVPGPGGDPRPLNFNLVLEMHYLPEEKRAGATRPTPQQIEVFRTVVAQLESKIRDHLNTFLTSQSFTNLMGERGPELVRAEVLRYVNNELEKYDFAAMGVPEDVSKRRVTNVLLPSWTFM